MPAANGGLRVHWYHGGKGPGQWLNLENTALDKAVQRVPWACAPLWLVALEGRPDSVLAPFDPWIMNLESLLRFRYPLIVPAAKGGALIRGMSGLDLDRNPRPPVSASLPE